MKKIVTSVAICLATLLYAGCATIAPVQNTTELQDVDMTQAFKDGQACNTYLFGFIPLEETSIVEGAREAGISKIEVVEYKFTNYIVATKSCVLMYGQ